MGIGDDLMALGDAARLRLDYPADTTMVIGNGYTPNHSPLYQYVPWLWQGTTAVPKGAEWVISYPGNRPYCDYERMIRVARERFGWAGGMDGREAFQLIKRKYWRSDYHATPAPVVLTREEVALGALLLKGLKRPVVMIEPNLKPGAAANKRWPFRRYQQVVDARKDHCTFVQFSRPTLLGVTPLPTQTVRDALGVVSEVDAYLGAEGGLHHASAALGKPAVVIFGGYISPSVTGYPFHQNLFVDCEDEGFPGPTPAGEAALASITVKQVVAALDMVLVSKGAVP